MHCNALFALSTDQNHFESNKDRGPFKIEAPSVGSHSLNYSLDSKLVLVDIADRESLNKIHHCGTSSVGGGGAV